MNLAVDFVILIIFGITYVGIALGRIPGLLIDRTGIALVGAIGIVVSGALSVEQAITYIDFSTILLLFGLMILSAQLRVAGFYRLVAAYILRWADKPLTLLSGVITASAILSSLFANDIVCLAFTPVLCEALLPARRNPLPYLIALATSSNIGSVATLIGNPQNMFIGQTAGLDFGHYAMVMIPVTIMGIVVNVVVVALIWPQEFLIDSPESLEVELPAHLVTFKPDRYLIAKTLFITGLLVATFLAGWPRDLAALTAAAVMLCSRRNPAHTLYALVDWNLIMLFLGLFVVIGALQEHKLMDQALATLTTNGLMLQSPPIFVAISTILSNLVSNVPAVLLLQDVPQGSQQLWYLLAMSSTLAGNLTLLGSIANLIVAEKAAVYKVHVGFREYVQIGLPLTLLTLLLGTVWVLVFG